MNRISVIIPAYNEEHRITPVVMAAVSWADEVIVVDKSSTDQTKSKAESLGARVITVPFKPQGCDDLGNYASNANSDWIFVLTCSEVPSKGLIVAVRLCISEASPEVEVIQIPKKIYSFGINNEYTPWGNCHHPFVFHRRRAIISDKIHQHVHASPLGKVVTIPFSEKCCIHHFTHPSVRRFTLAHLDYAEEEARSTQNPRDVLLRSCRDIFSPYTKCQKAGEHWPLLFAAWILVNVLNFMATWEKHFLPDVNATYGRRRAELLKEDWGIDLPYAIETTEKQASPPFDIDFSKAIQTTPAGKASILYRAKSRIVRSKWLRSLGLFR